MTSQSFDGEYIARFHSTICYGAARGSSTRGSCGAIIEMARLMRPDRRRRLLSTAERSTLHRQMGAVLLAKKRPGNRSLPFTVVADRYWTAKKSWDQFQVPLPFTRARSRIAPPIYVSSDANEGILEAKRNELQQQLDEIED